MQALFIWGGWEGHEPRRCTEHVASLFEGWAVEVSDSLDVIDRLADPSARPNVLVPCWTMGELSPERTRMLLDAALAGMGVAGWHGGMGDAFRDNTDFQFLVGGQFVAHPGGIIDHTVGIADHDHPVTLGLTDFAIRSEQYFMHVDPSNHLLADTTFSGEHCPWIDGCVMPVAWTRRYGTGRVFYCSIGHTAEDLMIPRVSKMIQRGIRWAARATD